MHVNITKRFCNALVCFFKKSHICKPCNETCNYRMKTDCRLFVQNRN